jgi:hypothetical protein
MTTLASTHIVAATLIQALYPTWVSDCVYTQPSVAVACASAIPAGASTSESSTLNAWVRKSLGDEPAAVAEDESARIPIRWVPGQGFVRQG